MAEDRKREKVDTQNDTVAEYGEIIGNRSMKHHNKI